MCLLDKSAGLSAGRDMTTLAAIWITRISVWAWRLVDCNRQGRKYGLSVAFSLLSQRAEIWLGYVRLPQFSRDKHCLLKQPGRRPKTAG